jgi:hypothetical protein
MHFLLVDNFHRTDCIHTVWDGCFFTTGLKHFFKQYLSFSNNGEKAAQQSIVLLEILTGPQVVKKFPAFCEL